MEKQRLLLKEIGSTFRLLAFTQNEKTGASVYIFIKKYTTRQIAMFVDTSVSHYYFSYTSKIADYEPFALDFPTIYVELEEVERWRQKAIDDDAWIID